MAIGDFLKNNLANNTLHAANAAVPRAAAVISTAGNLAAATLHSAAPLKDLVVLPRREGSLPTHSIEDVVLLLAITANCMLILAPLRSSLQAVRRELCAKEIVGHMAPTFLLFGQSYFWACYGLWTGQPDISRFNSFGAGMCALYLSFLCQGAREGDHMQDLHIRTGVSAALGATVLASFFIFLTPLPIARQSGLLALAATAFSMLQSAAPMLQAVEVLQSMSPQGFPLAMALSSCVSSILWAQYALMVHDPVYFVPNAINSAVGVGELAIVSWVLHRTRMRKGQQHPAFCGVDRPLMPRVAGKWAASAGSPGQFRLDSTTGCKATANTTYNSAGAAQSLQDAAVKLLPLLQKWPLVGDAPREDMSLRHEAPDLKRSATMVEEIMACRVCTI